VGNRARSVGRVRAVTVGMSVIALLMTGCSSGGEGDGQINGADGGKEQTKEPENEEQETPDPADDETERPDIKVPDDLELIFEDRETGDPVKDAILLDNEWQIKSVYEVISTHDLAESSVSFYTQGQALIDTMGMLERIVERGATGTGVIRFYKGEVDLQDDGAAVVTYCRDFSGSITNDFATREVIEEADGDAKPEQYVARLEESDLGVWQTVDESVEPEAKDCR
jgi:hypothetical protein